MMVQSIVTLLNLYPGINAHLHSALQTQGGWVSFHALHIGDLTKVLNVQLEPLGYEADIEQSLQIKRFDHPPQYPRADVLVYHDETRRSSATPSRLSSVATAMVLPALLDIVEPDQERYKSVAIYRQARSRPERGEPVVWIELLSPSNKPANKPDGQDATLYRAKREALLQAGLIFIELDYLHQQSPTFNTLADYTDVTQPDAYPYRIVVLEPRPDMISGMSWLYQWHVNEPIPVVTIPLLHQQTLDFDFGVPYAKTFSEMRYGKRIDYAHMPVNFDAYRPIDQQHIVNRMIAIMQAMQAGADLQTATLTIPDIPLSKALEQWQALAAQE